MAGQKTFTPKLLISLQLLDKEITVKGTLKDL